MFQCKSIKNNTYSIELMNKLNYYRKKIDLIDKKIVELLLLRFKLIKQLSNYKQKNKFKIVDKKREIQVINNIKKY